MLNIKNVTVDFYRVFLHSKEYPRGASVHRRDDFLTVKPSLVILVKTIHEDCLYPNDYKLHCKVIIGRNPIEANANTVAIQLPGNPVAYIGKCFTPY